VPKFAHLFFALPVHFEQVFAVEGDCAFGDFIAFAARQNLCERALARTIRPYNGMHFAQADFQVHALQNFVVVHPRVKVFNFKQTNTLTFEGKTCGINPRHRS
jgi:hypothetical protein